MSDDTSQQTSLDEIVDEHTEKAEDETVNVGELQEKENSPIEGWELRRLGDVFSLEYGENLTEDERDGGEYPVYGSNGQVGSHSEAYVTQPGIIVGRKGSIGEVEFCSKPFYPIDTTYYISQRETDENLRFLYYLLENMQLSRLNAASAIPGLNRNDAYSLKGLIPPLREQRKIASVLYNIDKAIRKTEKIISQTTRVRDGLTQDFFSESNTGQWKSVKFEDLITDIRYGTDEKSNQSEEGYPTLRIPNVVEGKINLSDLKHTELTEKEADRLILEEGDILTVRTNGNPNYVGRCIPFEEQEEDFVFASYLIRMRVDESQVRSKYVTEFLNSSQGRNEMSGWIRTSAGNYNLGISAIERFEIPVPKLEEQSKIINKLRSIDDSLNKSEEYKNRLQRLKRGLMQELLTGEVRTTNRDINVLPEVENHG